MDSSAWGSIVSFHLKGSMRHSLLPLPQSTAIYNPRLTGHNLLQRSVLKKSGRGIIFHTTGHFDVIVF